METESQGSEAAHSELAWGRVSSCPRSVRFPRPLLKPLGTNVCVLSHLVVSDSATPWTAARQALLATGFFRQEYWSGLPFPPPGDLPNPGIEPHLLCLLHYRQILYPLSHQGSPRALAVPDNIHSFPFALFRSLCPLLSHLSITIALRNKHHKPPFEMR